MHPRLVALSGPLDGSTFRIPEGQFAIGRGTANDLTLEDGSVSRHHCVIRRLGDELELIDLGSHNHCYVNNLAVERHLLRDGDELSIGRSTFLFLTREEPGGAAVELVPADSGQAEPTLILRLEDAIYLNPQKAVSGSGDDRHQRALRCLLDTATAISSERDLAALASKVLAAMSGAIPMHSGAILLRTDGGEDEYRQFFRASPSMTDAAIRPSSSVVRRVISEKVAVCFNDSVSAADAGFGASIVSLRIESVMAVPLVLGERCLGAVYAATHGSGAAFDETDLQVLTGIAGISAGSLDAARRFEELEQQNRHLQARIRSSDQLIGESAAMEAVRKVIAKVAPAISTVLITGESGTGKELAARAICRNSPRADLPFVAINCAALTESLLESELFGHEKGAFTGAVALKKGRLDEADGGTLFLDEVGEMSPALQAKLLRVLQEREYERVGGITTIRCDIRVIAATNRNLGEMARSGAFRQDLYYRLNVVSFEMPPLRSRGEDISLLAQYFIQKHAHTASRRVSGVAPEAMRLMRRYEWPGNVRELQNAIERALVLGLTENIEPDDLPDSVLESGAPSSTEAEGFHEMVNEAKRRIVIGILQEASGNYSEAARRLRIHPNNLHRLIRNLALKIPDKR